MLKFNFSAILFLLFQHLNAQDIGLSDSLSKQLIISHSKYEISEKSSYKPFVLVDKKEIENQVLDDIGVLLDAQIGINVVGAYSNPGKDKSLFLQGAGGEYTLILLDGIPITDPSGIGGSFDLRSFSLAQVERIEIIKGAQSALYGSDAIAGVVNLVTKKDANGHQAGVQLSYGSHNTRKISGDVLLPFEGGNLNLRLGHSGTSGISEALDLMDAGFDSDGFSRIFADASIMFNISDNLDVSLFGRYSVYDGGYDGGAFFDAPDEYNTDWLNSGISIVHSSESSGTTGSITINKTERIFDSESFGISAFNGTAINSDIYHHREINSFLKASLGINLQHLSMQDENLASDPSIRILSPYGSLSALISQKSNVEIGFRYNDHEAFGANTNWTFGFSHWFTNRIKVHSFYGTSFKAPNLFQLYGQFGANPKLRPQTGRTLNIGLSSYQLGYFQKMSVSLFVRSVDDQIAYIFPEGYTNVTVQRDFGIEASISSDFGKLGMTVAYEYLIGEAEDRRTGTVMDNLFRRPRHTVELNASFNYRKSDMISLGIRQIGNRNDLFFDNNTFLTEAVILEAYLLGNVLAEFTFNDRAQLKVQINNIFNSDFQEIAGFTTLGTNLHIGFNYTF